MLPDLIAHADWGSAPKKRWMAVAEVRDGAIRALAPEPVGDVGTLWDRLEARAPGPRVLAGFDVPIGLPAAYARRVGLDDFSDALQRFGTGEWSAFYRLAEARGEISLRRPFYPYRPGGTRQAHLVEALGVGAMADLLRRCERPTATRAAASPLFWTLGGKQVGRAAIVVWRDLLAPALRAGRLRLWPFDGGLEALLEGPGTVACETYPAEACVHLGFGPPGRGWSKTSQDGRRAQADALLAWAERRGVRLGADLRARVLDGFGPRSDAEDPFDAVLGLFSMVEVAGGWRAPGAPDDPEVRGLEGWILGQDGSSEPSAT